jgi:alanine racemase
MSVKSLNRVEIDLTALKNNYQAIKNIVGSKVEVVAMVKSDAYGHGLVAVAKTLSAVGATIFGVAEVDEGVSLRQAGITGDIIVLLGAASADYHAVIQNRLSPVVYDLRSLQSLSSLAEELGEKVSVHLKVDIGMGRLGVMPEDVVTHVKSLAGLKGIRLAGVFSHFPMADAADADVTVHQYRNFLDLLEKIKTFVPTEKIFHAANSAAVMRFPETHFDMVRPGITVYGCYPPGLQKYENVLALEPVMSFKSNVIQTKDVPAGYGLSYGHRFITQRPTRVAVLPVGYDDGYLRRLTGKAEVLIRGRRAKILGMICMNACMADITDIPDVQVDDEVVLMGRQGNEAISADEIAAWSETINYEIVCLLGGRNRKVYIN